MKITFAPSLEDAPKGFARVFLSEKARGSSRIVKEDGIERLEVGAGAPAEMNRRKFITLCRSVVAAAKGAGFRKIALQFDATPELFKNLSSISPEDLSSIAAQNFEMANFEFTLFKTPPKEGWPGVDEIMLCGKAYASIYKAAARGQEIGKAVNACRELANTPSSDMPPQMLAKAAKAAVKGLPVTVNALGVADMEKLGMGAVLGVGKGSSQEPAFIIMEYKPGGAPKGKGEGPIVLIGKGVTFDSGGINLKPDGGHEMHMDMSGGAAVIHAVALAATLKLKKHVVGLVPAVENMPGPGAYRIHDVLKSLSGKTIEIMHTDAEGRVILADALAYAKRYKPSVVIDVATLTGAALVALGQFASGLFTRDEDLAARIEALAEASGDYVWRLPLWDEYEPAVKGTVGDVVNAQSADAKYGGATNGAMFLWQFAKDLGCPWAHLDIAPRMTSVEGEGLAKGATGEPVRLLASFIAEWKP